jgi:hypothetical protein
VLRGIAVGVAVPVLASPLDATAATSTPRTDPQLIAASFAIEQLVVLAYGQVLASGALHQGAESTVAGILEQEREHVQALGGALQELGAATPPGPTVATGDQALAAHKVPGSVSNLRTQHDCLKLLVDLESAAEGAHYVAVSKLRRAKLLVLSAEILACEAQHWTVLSELQHPGKIELAVPGPFVQGARS